MLTRATKLKSSQEAEGIQSEYEVEQVLDCKNDFYLVKWKGYSIQDCTWEPRSNLNSCADLILTYSAQIAKGQIKPGEGYKKYLQARQKRILGRVAQQAEKKKEEKKINLPIAQQFKSKKNKKQKKKQQLDTEDSSLISTASTEAGCFEKHQFKKVKHVFKLGGQVNVVIEWKSSKKNKILDTVYEINQVPEKYLEDIFMFLAAAKNLISE